MTLTVEDGTGLPSANSYISVEDADAYFALRGNAVWAALDVPAKETALVLATEFIDLRWGSKLQGRPVKASQALAFPRYPVYSAAGLLLSATSVPEGVARGCCEYALQSVAGALYNVPQSAAKDVKKKRVVVGPVTTETEYFNPSNSPAYVSIPKADAYIKPYTNSSSGVVRN